MSDRPDDKPGCDPEEHGQAPNARFADADVSRAVRLFRALADEARLRTLELLAEGELCVSEIAEASEEDNVLDLEQ